MKKFKAFTAVFASLVLITAVGCEEKKGGGDSIVYYNSQNQYSQAAEGYEDSQGAVIPENEKIENIPTIAASRGEKAELSGIDITITDVIDAGIMKSGEDTVNFDRQAVAVVCEVTNNTSEEMSVNALDFEIRYMDGEETMIVMDAQAMMAAMDNIKDYESLNAVLKPGETVTGYAAFGIYSRWESFTVYFKPDSMEAPDSVAVNVTRDMVSEAQKN